MLILPDAISKLNLSKKDDDNDNYYYYETPSKQKKITIDRTTVANCLSLQHLPYCSKKWLTQMSSALTQHMDRTLAYDILTPLLTKKNVSASPLREALLRTAIEFLKEKTKIKPEPPNNWSRPVPKSKTYANKWNILKSFMESPTQTTFDYVQKERCRIEMKKAIKRAKADLDTETIRKGRPYTLRITKNQKTYKRLLKQWQKDIKLLAKLERALNAL
ncbi:MAG TPA: hypothetical protein ENJ45_00655 [Phaeodactylibacter sp.]|nr:hypothetical protein [Phaeodactylibacter sp.]